jgi:predicted O-methyltransferase YrrM
MSSPELQNIWTQNNAYHDSFLLPAGDEVLERIVENNKANDLADIAVSPSEGKFLYLVARSIGAKRILEVGTLGGYVCLVPLAPSEEVLPVIALLTSVCRYSTTWLARAVPEDGAVTTLDISPHCVQVATENLTTAGLIHKVNIILGPATETIETLSPTPTPFDLAFIDANSESNVIYFKHAKRLLRKGGVIVRILQRTSNLIARVKADIFVCLDRRQRCSKWQSIRSRK